MLMGLLLGIVAFVPLIWRLYGLMIREYDYYSRLALRNQTRTTTVMANRGTIYDRNMNILATSVGVENVYLDPHELKQSKADLQDMSRVLGQLLEKDPVWILEQAGDLRQRYKQVGSRLPSQTADKIRAYINEKGISGIH